MATRSGYGEACPVAHALDLIGDRWALLVVRELRLGPKRFTDLQISLPNAGPNVLSQRLRDLEQTGVLSRRTLPPPAPAKVYELTEWGYELEPAFQALAQWGMRSPVVKRAGTLSADSVLLSVRTFFDSTGMPPWTASYSIRLEHEVYAIQVTDGVLIALSRGDTAELADAILLCPRSVLNSLLSKELTVQEAIESRQLSLNGDVHAAERLVAAVRKGR